MKNFISSIVILVLLAAGECEDNNDFYCDEISFDYNQTKVLILSGEKIDIFCKAKLLKISILKLVP